MKAMTARVDLLVLEFNHELSSALRHIFAAGNPIANFPITHTFTQGAINGDDVTYVSVTKQ